MNIDLNERDITLIVNSLRDSVLNLEGMAQANRENGNGSAADTILELAAEYGQLSGRIQVL